jgi:ElaA protein
MTLAYQCLPFAQLSPFQVYDILKLRQEVFVVEQNCIFLDPDDKDQLGHHCLGCDEMGKLHAYTRLLAPGIAYDDYASIGRVITSQAARGGGHGRRLMEYSIDALYICYGRQPIKIGAQSYLKQFYGSLGFEVCGEEYLEDGIPHVPMLRGPIWQVFKICQRIGLTKSKT